MSHKMLALLGPVLLALLPVTANAAEPIILAPSTVWNVDYGEEVCALRRAFGTGDDELTLQISKFDTLPAMQLSLSGKKLHAEQSNYAVTVGFGPASLGKTEKSARAGLAADRTPILLFGDVTINASLKEPENLKPAESNAWEPPFQTVQQRNADELSANQLQVSQSGGSDFVLQTGPMLAPMNALRVCVDAMIKSWGLDPAEQARLRNRPKPTTTKAWLRTMDYPPEMVRNSQQGVVNFRLMVEADGAVSGCFIQAGAGHKDFREVTCQLLKRRARLTPAIGSDGVPVRSYFTGAVNWVIP